MFGVYLGTNPANVQKATDLIFQEITRLNKTLIDSEELSDAKEFTKGNLLLASENNDSQMVRLAQNETHFQRYIPLQEIIDNIDAVTADQILELAENIVQKKRFALTMLGPVNNNKETFAKVVKV